MTDHLKKYIDYIKNTGRTPLRVDQFDDDWEPIGPLVRRDLQAARLITVSSGEITLIDEGS